jgi:predicted phage terminase large subunit-like protein
MAMFGLRVGKDPRCLITTTPKPIKIFKQLIAREGQDVVVTRGSTFANAANLARPFLNQMTERYGGTRLGRQELYAELLTDTVGALWSLDTLEATRVRSVPPLKRIVVAIDPAGSSSENADETGIIVAGVGDDGHGYVIADLSGRFAPHEWARTAIGAYHSHQADRIIAERNFGGEMVEATISSVDPDAPVKTITSSRGKVLRAEPVAALFEQRRVHLVGSFPELEEQMCSFTADWSRARDGSPDRVDALVFALAELVIESRSGGFFDVNAIFCEEDLFDEG